MKTTTYPTIGLRLIPLFVMLLLAGRPAFAGTAVQLPAMPSGQYLITVVDDAGILRGGSFR